ELASGVLVEFSGAFLALYLYSNLLKRFLVKLFVATMLVTLIAGNGVLSVVLTCLITITLWILFTVISVTLGRSRVDLAPRTLAKYYIGLFIIPIAGLVVLAYG
ncbi:MAG: NADH-quinone oxidoreductase subunit H, partial [Desulfurococcaceae archaeon]